MIKLPLQVVGWILAHTPEGLLRGLAWGLARLFYYGVGSRRRLIRANLHHAFPARSSLAAPFLPPRRITAIVRATPSLTAFYAAQRAQPKATIMCGPHLAHWEVQTAQPLLVDAPFPELGIIFRPLDNPGADAWLKKTRGRFGLKLFSRKEGFQQAVKLLRRQGIVAVLFDQNAGGQGALTLLFDRVCSTSELAGVLASRFGAELWGIYPRYLGFWRVELVMEPVASDGSAEGATVALNRWLERVLRADEKLIPSWLWGHHRWKSQDLPSQRLRLELKRNFLAADLRARGLAAPPRRTRFWIRLPNWLGDVVMALPLLRAIRAGRPDAEITLVAKPQFLPLLEHLGVADRLRPLPARGAGYFAHFWRLRAEFPDCFFLFTNSARGDLEAWLTGCRQRFGLARPGKWRPLLSHAYAPPAGCVEAQQHQFELWLAFLRHFGLVAAPDLAPFPLSTFNLQPSTSARIGLICGSENSPEKRWPVEHWRALVAALPGEHFTLFGTARDRAITDAVAAGFGDRVENLAGRTDLLEFATRLRACRLLVANDTGGMHLANALGVPVVALFGPTNPERTGPVFSAPVSILQPPGCAPAGGGALADLHPATVGATVRTLL
ncbi:MAG: hypothetical protein HY302_06425 [Opitutae bacterium]|nr:hypothetical protein [Opitutae bacterium]